MSPQRKICILYVNHTGLVSGAERVLLEILRGLNRERFEPLVSCPAEGELSSEVARLGVEWQPMPAPRARFSWRPDRALRASAALIGTARILRRQIRIAAPDLIHANSVRAGIVATLAARGTGTTVLWHVHDTLPRHPLSSAVRAFAFLSRNARFIAVSQSTANSFRGRLPFGARLFAIHNGVDLRMFPVKQSGVSEFRQSLGLLESDFLVCAIGQICARKGLLELIGALGRIRHQGPSIHLTIVGQVVFRHEEEYLKTLHAATGRLELGKRVHFTGELSNVSPVLQAADLLILNSHDEPFGLVLIEAMASGTPVLATRVGGIPEIITDTKDGWLVKKGDTEALASKLLDLSQRRDQLADTSQRALQTARLRFSIERFGQEIERLYAKLNPDLDRKRGSNNRAALMRSTNN